MSLKLKWRRSIAMYIDQNQADLITGYIHIQEHVLQLSSAFPLSIIRYITIAVYFYELLPIILDDFYRNFKYRCRQSEILKLIAILLNLKINWDYSILAHFSNDLFVHCLYEYMHTYFVNDEIFADTALLIYSRLIKLNISMHSLFKLKPQCFLWNLLQLHDENSSIKCNILFILSTIIKNKTYGNKSHKFLCKKGIFQYLSQQIDRLYCGEKFQLEILSNILSLSCSLSKYHSSIIDNFDCMLMIIVMSLSKIHFLLMINMSSEIHDCINVVFENLSSQLLNLFKIEILIDNIINSLIDNKLINIIVKLSSYKFSTKVRKNILKIISIIILKGNSLHIDIFLKAGIFETLTNIAFGSIMYDISYCELGHAVFIFNNLILSNDKYMKLILNEEKIVKFICHQLLTKNRNHSLSFFNNIFELNEIDYIFKILNHDNGEFIKSICFILNSIKPNDFVLTIEIRNLMDCLSHIIKIMRDTKDYTIVKQYIKHKLVSNNILNIFRQLKIMIKTDLVDLSLIGLQQYSNDLLYLLNNLNIP